MEASGLRSISKIPVIRVSGEASEWTTLAQLEDVILQPSEYLVQSFFTRLRILSDTSLDAFNSFCYSYVSLLGFDFDELQANGEFVQVLDILWAILEKICFFDPPQQKLWDLTIIVVKVLVNTLSRLEMDDPLFSIESIKTTLNLILGTDQFHSGDEERVHTDSQMKSLLQLVATMAIVPDVVDRDNLKILIHLIRPDRRNLHGETLLHMACIQYIDSNNLIDIVRLLLQAHADPDVGDATGSVPLHILAKYNKESNKKIVDSTAGLLLDYGAHQGRTNHNGMTALEVWNASALAGGLSVLPSDNPSWYRAKAPTLSCLSSKVVRRNHIIHQSELYLELSPHFRSAYDI